MSTVILSYNRRNQTERGREAMRGEESIPTVLPAALTPIHGFDKASLPCKGCMATAESNGLLEKEYLLPALMKNHLQIM